MIEECNHNRIAGSLGGVLLKGAVIIVIITALSVLNYFNYTQWSNEKTLRAIEHGSLTIDEARIRDVFYSNPEITYRLSLLQSTPRKQEPYLLDAIRGCPAWSGLHIARFQAALEQNVDGAVVDVLYGLAHFFEPTNITTGLNYGHYLFRKGDWQAAYDVYSRIMTIEPDTMSELLPLLWLIEPDFSKLEQNVPMTDETYSVLGRAFEKKGRFAEAIEVYKRALAVNPLNHANRKRMLELTHKKLGDYKAVLTLARESLELIEPGQVEGLDYLYYKMEANRLLGRELEARHEASKIAKLCENDPNWFYLLGRFYRDIGLFTDGEQVIKRAIQADRFNPLYHEFLGDLYQFNRKPGLALLKYTDAYDILKKTKAEKQVIRIQEKIADISRKNLRGGS